jgi:hypothetical protein
VARGLGRPGIGGIEAVGRRHQPPGAAAGARLGDRARRRRRGRPAARWRLIGELVTSGRVLAPPHFVEPFGRLVSEAPAGGVGWLPLA